MAAVDGLAVDLKGCPDALVQFLAGTAREDEQARDEDRDRAPNHAIEERANREARRTSQGKVALIDRLARDGHR
jgi:hypothetical protein